MTKGKAKLSAPGTQQSCRKKKTSTAWCRLEASCGLIRPPESLRWGCLMTGVLKHPAMLASINDDASKSHSAGVSNDELQSLTGFHLKYRWWAVVLINSGKCIWVLFVMKLKASYIPNMRCRHVWKVQLWKAITVLNNSFYVDCICFLNLPNSDRNNCCNFVVLNLCI